MLDKDFLVFRYKRLLPSAPPHLDLAQHVDGRGRRRRSWSRPYAARQNLPRACVDASVFLAPDDEVVMSTMSSISCVAGFEQVVQLFFHHLGLARMVIGHVCPLLSRPDLARDDRKALGLGELAPRALSAC